MVTRINTQKVSWRFSFSSFIFSPSISPFCWTFFNKKFVLNFEKTNKAYQGVILEISHGCWERLSLKIDWKKKKTQNKLTVRTVNVSLLTQKYHSTSPRRSTWAQSWVSIASQSWCHGKFGYFELLWQCVSPYSMAMCIWQIASNPINLIFCTIQKPPSPHHHTNTHTHSKHEQRLLSANSSILSQTKPSSSPCILKSSSMSISCKWKETYWQVSPKDPKGMSALGVTSG